MDDVLRAVRSSISMRGEVAEGVTICDISKSGAALTFPPGLADPHQLAVLKELKDELVGHEGAKAAALRAGVIEELLKILDAANGLTYEAALLQAMGLLAILSSSREDVFTAHSSRIVAHVARALKFPVERIRATALRALCLLSVRLIPQSNEGLSWPENEKAESASTALGKVSAHILREVADERGWSMVLRTLGAESLAALTRDAKLARYLLPAIVLTGTDLLWPLLPTVRHRSTARGSIRATVGRTEPTLSTSLPPLLEILLNLSNAEPKTVAAWLMDCAANYSPWGALRGVEMELNGDNEKVRTMASLILVNCFRGTAMETATGASSLTLPSRDASPTKPWPDGTSCGAYQALNDVIAHRVLPLLFRTVRTWATLPSSSPRDRPPSAPSASYVKATSFGAACGDGYGAGYLAAAVAEAVATVLELSSWQRQREAVSYGAVDAFTTFLRKAHTVLAEAATLEVLAPERGHGRDDDLPSRRGLLNTNGALRIKQRKEFEAELSAVLCATKAALLALAALCSRCELARERVVALGFHATLTFWITRGEHVWRSSIADGSAQDNIGDGIFGGRVNRDIHLAALLLARNLSRSGAPCSALVGVGVHESLIRLMGEGRSTERLKKTRDGRRETMENERLALTAGGLANMVLEHEIVKEVITGSTCLRRVCMFAVDISSAENVRSAAMALIKSTCFLAPLHVRVEVAYCLGGIDGMLRLVQGPRNDAVLQGLQTLRNLVHAIPLWALCRLKGDLASGETTTAPRFPERGAAAATAGSAGSAGSTVLLRGASQALSQVLAQSASQGALSGTLSGSATRREGETESTGAGSDRPESNVASSTIVSLDDDPHTEASPGSSRERRERPRGDSTGDDVVHHRSNSGGTNDGIGVTGARRFWGELDTTPAVATLERDASSRHGVIGLPEPMEVDFQASGQEECHVEERKSEWRRQTGRRQEGLGVVKLIEAVLGTLEGAATGEECDETSCAALCLLHVLSAADDSQRAALRTPRVLHLIMPYLLRDNCSTRRPPQSLMNSPAGTHAHESSNSMEGGEGGQLRWRRRRESSGDSDDDHFLSSPSSSPRERSKRTPPCEAADVAARLLLGQLLPQRPGDSMTTAIAALAMPGLGMTGILGRHTAAMAQGGRESSGARVREDTGVPVGSWCSDLEFDEGGGGGRRPGRE